MSNNAFDGGDAVIGFDGDCDLCTYSQMYGVSFTPSKPCDCAFQCLTPTRHSGHGAGSGICCIAETELTGCPSDETPDCDDGYSSNCIYDGGYEGGCIRLGFGEAPKFSCTERMIRIDPEGTYRVGLSFSVFAPCGTYNDIVRGKCEGQPALYANSGSSGAGAVTVPSVGFAVSGNDFDFLCDEMGGTGLTETPLHARGVRATQLASDVPCSAQDNYRVLPALRNPYLHADCPHPCDYPGADCDADPPVPGNCGDLGDAFGCECCDDYRTKVYSNHLKQAPLYGNPDHSIGPDTSIIRSCFDCKFGISGTHGGVAFQWEDECPVDEDGSILPRLNSCTGFNMWCPDGSNRDAECQPNQGCIMGECEGEESYPLWGSYVPVQNYWGVPGYCSAWQCDKQVSRGYAFAQSGFNGVDIPDPRIIEANGNCAIKIKTCVKQAKLKVGFGNDYAGDDFLTLARTCAATGCPPVCWEAISDKSPNCFVANDYYRPFYPLSPFPSFAFNAGVGFAGTPQDRTSVEVTITRA